MNKTAGLWRCDRCCVKITQLHRAFGRWPVDSFSRLSVSEQQSFMNSVKSVNRGKETVSQLSDFLSKYETHESYYEDKGKFLPLSVWDRQGYDVQMIKDRSDPKDKMVHPILGDVCRVRILNTGARGAEGLKQLENLKAREKPLTKKAKTAAQSVAEPVAEADEAAAAADEAAAGNSAEQNDDSDSTSDSDSDSSSSSSSSRSSSSSSSRRKSKKGKRSKKNKSKKAKKAKKQSKKAKKHSKQNKNTGDQKSKEELAAEREDAAKARAAKTLATQALSKLVPVLSSLTTTMAKPESVNLPACVANAVAKQFGIIQAFDKECRSVLVSDSTSLSAANMKVVNKMTSEAKKVETVMNHMLITLNKL